MFLSIAVPLKVMGLGVLISYGIAVLIKLLLSCIRLFGHKEHDSNQNDI
ncbi:hypothetical protein [Anaerosporobacter faecicola]|nr:hypothetical protein [Anaerosporobacter faecicola]